LKTRRLSPARRQWIQEKSRKSIFLIPSLFTVSNIFCGFYSVSSAIRGNYELAGLLIGIAMILDTLDGRIARLTHTSSEFGVQLDSLADVITFGMAPAVLSYQWAFRDFEIHSVDRAGWLACFLFLISAASRLARFNVQTATAHDKRYFVGMPTPAAAGFVAAMVYAFPNQVISGGPATAVFTLMLLLAFLMVSRIKYRSFKDLNLKQPHSYRITVIIALIFVAMALDLAKALITLAVVYAVSGLLGFVLSKRRRPAEMNDPAATPPKVS
jgi:CDP-diacylglycerol--serine O-phosphatidyltransferase